MEHRSRKRQTRATGVHTQNTRPGKLPRRCTANHQPVGLVLRAANRLANWVIQLSSRVTAARFKQKRHKNRRQPNRGTPGSGMQGTGLASKAVNRRTMRHIDNRATSKPSLAHPRDLGGLLDCKASMFAFQGFQPRDDIDQCDIRNQAGKKAMLVTST